MVDIYSSLRMVFWWPPWTLFWCNHWAAISACTQEMSTFDEHTVGTNSRLNPGVPDMFLAAANKRKKAKIIPDCNLAVIPFKVDFFCSPFLSQEHVLPMWFGFPLGKRTKGASSHVTLTWCVRSVSYANLLALLAFSALTQITLLF